MRTPEKIRRSPVIKPQRQDAVRAAPGSETQQTRAQQHGSSRQRNGRREIAVEGHLVECRVTRVGVGNELTTPETPSAIKPTDHPVAIFTTVLLLRPHSGRGSLLVW